MTTETNTSYPTETELDALLDALLDDTTDENVAKYEARLTVFDPQRGTEEWTHLVACRAWLNAAADPVVDAEAVAERAHLAWRGEAGLETVEDLEDTYLDEDTYPTECNH